MTRFLLEPPAAEMRTEAVPDGRFLLEPPAEPKKAGALDRTKAAAAGVNKGFFADLLGMPVDAAANVVDLVKAGVGTVAGLAGRPDLMPEVSSDRSGIVGSSQWIERKINEGGMGAAINNPNPEDRMSRVLHMGGRVAGASIVPDPRAKVSGVEQLARMGMGEVSGLAAGTVGEWKPEYAGLAGMTPQLAASVAAAGVKQAIHGGEAGRRVMEQRIQDFKNAGVDEPSLGLATGNKTIQGIENMLSVTPGSVGVYERHKNAILDAMQGRAAQIRDRASTVYGPEETGLAIQSDLKGPFKGRVNAMAKVLNDRVVDVVGSGRVVEIPETLLRAEALSTPIKGAEATSGQLINPRIAQIAENLRSDIYGAPVAPSNVSGGNPTLNSAMSPAVQQRVVANGGLWNIPTEASAPLPRIATGNPTILAAQSEPVANSSLWNTPSRTVSNPSLWNAPAVSESAAQRGGPNPTLNLPLSKAVESVPVANPGLWNIPVDPVTPMPTRSQMISRQEIPNASLWNAQKENGIPFAALKALRTSIGDEAASSAIIGTPEQAQFKRLYGAMSEDMRQAVNATDRQNAGVPVGPLMPNQQPGSAALNRANTYYSRAATRAEELDPIANRNTPEGAYSAVAKSLESGPTVWQRLRGAVTPETRQKVVASVIDDLGRAAPGQQGADGEAWSPRAFLTNYNRLDPHARTELFKRIPGGSTMAADLRDVAKAAEMISDSSKVWANPSGTAAATVSRGTIVALVPGAFLSPLGAGIVAGGMLLNNQASQRLLLNPKFVNWLAKAPKVTPAGMQSYAQTLIAASSKSNDPQFKRDVAEYLALVNDGAQQGEQ